MPDLDLDEVPAGKVYNTTNISIATFVGGLLVGTYLISENFKVLGDRRKAAITWAVAIFLFIVVIMGSAFIPLLDQTPNYVYTIFFAFSAGWAARHFQSKKINEHIEKGGDVYPTKRVVVITLIGLAIIVAVALAAFFIQDNMISHSR